MQKIVLPAVAWVLCLTLTPAACAGPDVAEDPGGGSLAWCGGGSSAAPAEGYSLEATSSPAGVEFGDVGGLAATAFGVFVLDPLTPQLLGLSPSLDRLLWKVDREGKGPGELSIRRSFNPFGRRMSWLTANDSALFLINDGRVHVFDPDGTFKSSMVEPIRGTPALLAVAGGSSLIYDKMGYDPLSGAFDPLTPRFRLLTYPGDEPLLDLPLARLPTARGAPFIGPSEALPLWATNGACAVVSNGSSDSLWIIDLESRRRAEVAIKTARPVEVTAPDLDPPPTQGGTEEEPDPSAIKRYDALAVSPAGDVWIRPFQQPQQDGYVVLVGNAATREFEVRRIRHFPMAFAPDGTYYAVHRDGLGVETIYLYARGRLDRAAPR